MEKLMNWLLMTSLLCAGCAIEVQDKDQNAKAQNMNVEVSQTLNAQQLNITAGGTTPQNYELHFSWPPVSGKIVIKKEDEVLTAAEGTTSEVVVSGFSSDKIYTFVIEHYDHSERMIGRFQQTYKTPKDIVVTSMALTGPLSLQADRIFILENSVITTYEHSLHLEAREIYAQKSAIQSFPESAKARPPQINGRSGGGITIVAEKIVGQLQLLLRGEHGADGRKHPISRCMESGAGNGGFSAPLTLKAKNVSKATVPYVATPGLGGRTPEPPPDFNLIGTPVCPLSLPAQGQDGQLGAVEIL